MVPKACFLLLLLLTTTFSTLVKGSKRTHCGRNGNSDTVCSPVNGDTWNQNGTYYLTTWNPLYPTYVSSSSLSLYIYFVEHYNKINVMSFRNISNTGEFPLLINDSWFDPSLHLHESIHDARLFLVSADVDPLKEMNNLNSAWPPPIQLFIVQASSKRQEPEAAFTASEKSSSSWVTPVIVVGCILLLVVGGLFALCFLRANNRRKRILDKKVQSDSTVYPTPSSSQQLFKRIDNRASPPTSSTYPNLSSIPPHLTMYSSRPTTVQSMSNLSAPPLTSTDALLIADTFRQQMRRPKWSENGPTQSSSTLSSSSSSSTINDECGNEERIRRLASEQLLKLELEAEGTTVKKMGVSD